MLYQVNLILVGTFVLVGWKVEAQVPPNFEDNVNTFAEKVVTCRDIVGLNLAVVQGDNTLLTNGYGKKNLDRNDDATSSTLFGIASLTKAFATTGLAAAMEDSSSFNWDSKTRDVFGDDFYFFDAERSSKSTLRDLGSHKIGLPPNNYARMQGQLTREKLAGKIRFYEPTRPYRESYWYNNLMYGLVSYATEVIGGDSWENVLKNKIFAPLGMDKTTFSHVTDMSGSDIATPYLYDNNQWRAVSGELHSEWGSLGGSGSIMTTAEDMTNWLKFQLNNYDTESSPNKDQYESVLSPDWLKELHTPQNIIPESSSDKLYRKPTCPVSYTTPNYGLGWRVGSYRGYPMIMHTGTSWGYGGHLILIPDKKIGVYSSITGLDSGYHGRRALQLYIIDLLLGETPWHNLTTACTYPDTSPSKKSLTGSTGVTLSAAQLSEYEGTYGNHGYGNITVTYNSADDSLVMTYGTIGKWKLATTATADEFTGEGQGDIWNINLRGVKFVSSAGVYDEVSVYTFNTALPPVFVRDLQMSSAPAPPDLECSQTSAASHISQKRALITVILATSLMMFFRSN